MNRRGFLIRLGVGTAALAVGTVATTGLVPGLPGVATVSPAGAVDGDTGPELVVNGSFEDGLPGSDPAGWRELV